MTLEILYPFKPQDTILPPSKGKCQLSYLDSVLAKSEMLCEGKLM